jgi:hypothetical protein
VRIRFDALEPVAGCPAFEAQRPSVTPDQLVVAAFFTCDADGPTLPVYRAVGRTAGVLRAALGALVAGPTPAERAAGIDSWFSEATARMFGGMALVDGAATVDLHDLRRVIPNASTSAGSAMLLSQLDATVFQFPSVRSAVYRIDGDCQAFTDWLQLGGCDPRRPPVTR